MTTCRTCQSPITRYSKSGLCRPCARKDPEVAARKSAAVKARYDADPDYRERQRTRTAEHNRSDKMRALAGEKAKALRIWEKGTAAMTPEVRKRAGRALVETRLGHIPRELREDYKQLIRNRWSREDATAAILASHEATMAQFRRKLIEAQE